MQNKHFILLLILSLGFIFPGINAQKNRVELDFRGQFIGWTNFNFGEDFTNQSGIRYLPELSAGYKMNESWKLDAEASLNAYGVGTISGGNFNTEGDLKPYRLWWRISSDRFFFRAGLQKINFGSASVLRPLMWFDQIDPRDPLQLTDGVYAALTRYYFLNNANLWFWVLYNNDERRGWDSFGSEPKTPEYGGRFQFPLGPGELAFSYHHRRISGDTIILPQTGSNIYFDDFQQHRVAIDGKWDVGPGLWFENSLKKNKISIIPGQKWTNKLTLGVDYTFGLGNGLNLLTEHLLWTTSEEIFKDPENINFTAFSANYPIGLFDRVSAIVYYSWEEEDLYRILTWNRQYDKFTLYLLAYWNPERFDIYRNNEAGNLFSGKGFQIMISINH